MFKTPTCKIRPCADCGKPCTRTRCRSCSHARIKSMWTPEMRRIQGVKHMKFGVRM